MIKAILFDMDGVIVDSEPLHFEAHKKALAHFGIDLKLEDYMQFAISRGDDVIYEKAAQVYGAEIDKKAVSEIKKRVFREIFDQNSEMFPGILETLKNFSEKYDLAIVSSGSENAVKYVVEKLDIGKYFKVIVTGDNVEKIKPFPDIYLKAIEALGYDKESCVAIEDSETGMSAAKNAGLKCIAIPCGFTKDQDFSRADIVLKSIKEVNEELINSLQ